MAEDWLVFDIETIADPALPPEDPNHYQAPANYKDETKIAAYKQDAATKAQERRALHPWKNAIIAVGLCVRSNIAAVVWTAEDHEETELLRLFWAWWGVAERRLGFGCNHFDLPTLLARSWILGVRAPVVEVRGYHADAVDLADRLACGAPPSNWESQRWYAERLGVPVASDYDDGSHVAEWHAAGDWPGIAMHCAEDVRMTMELARRLSLLERSA